MEYVVENSSIILKDNIGNVLAKVEFEKVEQGVYNIFHTYVSEELRGKNVAKELVKRAVNEIHKKNAKVIATCSYAKKLLEKDM